MVIRFTQQEFKDIIANSTITQDSDAGSIGRLCGELPVFGKVRKLAKTWAGDNLVSTTNFEITDDFEVILHTDESQTLGFGAKDGVFVYDVEVRNMQLEEIMESFPEFMEIDKQALFDDYIHGKSFMNCSGFKMFKNYDITPTCVWNVTESDFFRIVKEAASRRGDTIGTFDDAIAWAGSEIRREKIRRISSAALKSLESLES